MQVCQRVRHFRQRANDAGIAPRGHQVKLISKKRRVPRHSKMPMSALQWPSTETAIFLLSLGVYRPFHPHGGGRGANLLPVFQPSCSNALMVSVICPTSDRRRVFHPLVYECFRLQTYEPRELVIVDSGSKPSFFFSEKSREDPRVIYRFFYVSDSKETDPMAAVILHNGWTEATAEMIKRKKGIEFKPQSGWSLGLKRNLACHLACGAVIAHFDDDDIYAPRYLAHM